MRYVFPSVINPTHRFAIYNSWSENPANDWRNSNKLCDYVSSFDTLGDGETQHTPEHCPSNTFENAEDFVMSLIPAITGIPTGEDCSIEYNASRAIAPGTMPSDELIKFIGGLKYDDHKAIYVNFSDMKKSSAESKQHDKRWTKLCSSYDGSEQAYKLGLYDAEIRGRNLIHSIQHDYVISRHCNGGSWGLAGSLSRESGSVFSGIDKDRLERFINAVVLLKDYFDAKQRADSSIDSLNRQSKRFIEARDRDAAGLI